MKRGAGTLNVKVDAIRQIDVALASDKSLPVLTITLTNGKTRECILATAGTFKGESDFGEINVPVNSLEKIIFNKFVLKTYNTTFDDDVPPQRSHSSS